MIAWFVSYDDPVMQCYAIRLAVKLHSRSDHLCRVLILTQRWRRNNVPPVPVCHVTRDIPGSRSELRLYVTEL